MRIRDSMKSKNRWTPAKINQGVEMTRCDFDTNKIEVRPLNWWEKIIYFQIKPVLTLKGKKIIIDGE